MRIKFLFLALFLSFSVNALGAELVSTLDSGVSSSVVGSIKSLGSLSLKEQLLVFVKGAAGTSFVLTKKVLSTAYGFEKSLFLIDKRAFCLFNLLMIYPVYRFNNSVKENFKAFKKRLEKFCSNIKNRAKDGVSILLLGAAGAVAYNALTAARK